MMGGPKATFVHTIQNVPFHTSIPTWAASDASGVAVVTDGGFVPAAAAAVAVLPVRATWFWSASVM